MQKESKSETKSKAEYQKEWRKKNPTYSADYQRKRRESEPDYGYQYRDMEKSREAAWRRRYGITRENYEAMLERQHGVCGICGTKEPGRGNQYFHVDHDHETKKVRGLLCDRCNRGIGLLGDNALIVIEAYKYLVGTKYASN